MAETGMWISIRDKAYLSLCICWFITYVHKYFLVHGCGTYGTFEEFSARVFLQSRWIAHHAALSWLVPWGLDVRNSAETWASWAWSLAVTSTQASRLAVTRSCYTRASVNSSTANQSYMRAICGLMSHTHTLRLRSASGLCVLLPLMAAIVTTIF
jgi:hypothetical protein